MSQQNRCPECGAELPSGTLGGLCPKCLLAAGLESRAEAGPAAGSGSEAPTTPHSGTFVPPDAASLAAHFPQLEILELLGHGGMGAVYKARQPKLDRMVALKIIRPESAHDPAFAERFNREARMLARLSHPRIVAVYDFGSVDVSLRETGPHAEHKGYTSRPLYYFLMEYVEGTNLRQLLQTGELLPQQALAIVPQICEALQFAHDEGIVHRDIKPENILLDKRGRVKIADFGLAKLVASSPQEFTLTGTHQVMGTPRYMAPEQMEGSHAVDHRADIYSLGVVFYEMLTGEVPMGHFEPPSQKVEIDVRLDEVVMRTLARAPQRRYQHASDVKNEVESISQTSWRAPTPEIRREIPIDDAEIKAARQQVQFPVIGLLVMGIFALPLAGRAFLSRYGDQTLSENPQQLLFWLAYFLPPLATLVGAVKMLQLSSYRWAVAASLLVMLSPAVLDQRQVWWIWWLCVLIGIWSLVVLSRPEVKRGFASQAQRTPGNPARVDPKGGSAQELGSQPRVP
ncbi:MAG TPA: protein kinase, partial [Lacipirellulaceae bacterium]